MSDYLWSICCYCHWVLYFPDALDGNDLFGMALAYNDVTSMGSLAPTALFNCNISAMKRKAKSDPVLRGYKFSYYKLNRQEDVIKSINARIENHLFISVNGSENIKNRQFYRFKAIQKECPEIINAEQIRKSVIVNWLKTLNLRQVQNMAGHKYVSSTERYQSNNLENLQNKLEKFHPLNKT